MQILTIPASNSRNGINRQLIDYSTRLIEGGLVPDATVATLDLNEYELPIFSIERQEADGVPAKAEDFAQRIGAADAVIVSFAEHNGSYTVAWKNIYDWASRIDPAVYQQKPVVMLSASVGPRGGALVLGTATATAEYFGAQLVGSLAIPTFNETFDAEAGALADPELDNQLKELLAKLAS